MEYGASARNQSTDNNAGFTGVQVDESSARTLTAQNKLAGTDQTLHLSRVPVEERLDGGQKMLQSGMASLAGAISEVAEVAQDGWRKDTTNKLALKAQAAQGTEIAINNMAKEKKRSPFMASVLGQTVTSRVSEAQSIQNATDQLYNTANEDMSKLAEMSTEDAIEHFAEISENLVSEIDDPELRNIALNNLMGQMPKLAQSHYKERYALERNKQVANNRQHIVNNLTALKSDLMGAPDPVEKLSIISTYAQKMFQGNDPLGLQQDELSKSEYRSLVLGQMTQDLQNGDKLLYDMARSLGADDKGSLTVGELEQMKEAEGQYDGHQNTMAQEVIASATLGLLEADSYEEMKAAANEARLDLKKWALEGTQSELDVKNQTVRRAQLERMLATSSSAWAKNQVKAENEARYKGVFSKPTNEQAKIVDTMSAKELKAASNAQIPELITQITGMPEIAAEQLAQTVFTDGLHYTDKQGNTRHQSPVTFAQNLTRLMVDDGRPVPDFAKTFVETQMRGMSIGSGEKGKKYSQEQRTSFRVMEALIEGNPALALTGDDAVHYEFMRQGFNANEPAESVNDRFAQYKANKGKQDMSNVAVKERKEGVVTTVNNLVDGNVTDRVMSSYYRDYQDILQSVGFDKQTAKSIFSKELTKGSSVVMGLKVSNGRQLDEALGDYGLNTLMKQASSVDRALPLEESMSFMTPILMTMFGTARGKDQKILKDASRTYMNGIEYVPGDDSVEFKVVGGSVTRVPLDELKRMGKLLSDRQEKLDAIETQMKLAKPTGSLGGIFNLID